MLVLSPALPISTSRSTASGCEAARPNAVAPPIELPMNDARWMPSAARNPRKCATRADCEYSKCAGSGLSVSPKPTMSMAMTRKWRANGATVSFQLPTLSAPAPPPWISTSALPLPASR